MAAASSSTPKPDHVIIWLDENMAIPENNKFEKKLLETRADVASMPRSASNEAIDQAILCVEQAIRDRLVIDPLHMFTDEDACLEFINECLANNKQPFLITSGRKGPFIVPDMHELLTGKIYVFCANRAKHEKWAKPYRQHLEIYDDEKSVFVTVLCGVAAYYVAKGQDDACNLSDADQYFEWSIKLYESATKIDGKNRDAFIEAVNIEVQEKYAKVALIK